MTSKEAKMFRRGVFTFLGVLLIAGAAWAVDPGPKCEAAKLKEAGKYHYCRMKAESKAVKKSEAPVYTKCVSKFNQKWPLIEQKGEGACPTNGDQSEMKTQTEDHVDYWALILHDPNYSPPGCGDGIADPNGNEQCDGADLGGASCTSLGYTGGGTLSCTVGCGYDTSLCECAPGQFPATGQTTCWDSSGGVIPCAGSGHDGEIQAGATLAYTDNGDGTISDLNTGLMWEKKSDDGSIHDKDTAYTWDNAFAVHVAGLNSAVFAGHTDWRLPNVKELQSIVDYERWSPSVDPVFHTSCLPACTVTSCSCTASLNYWSSATVAYSPGFAWLVYFYGGDVLYDAKGGGYSVRAVRGGL
jgi:hypothetical protein